MSQKLNIRLTIAGKSYPLSIERENEEKYRRAEVEINELVTEFRGRFRAENEDYLAMAALQIALANIEMEMSRSLGDKEVDALAQIDRRLGNYLDALE
ncbi:MAG: cell division protein ZapA [Rikenellaceae bacterium]|nr:cell division protein ZapA [Rikenellaceae bacterium]MCL2692195.1 cell division protein ZapA [Rikenellaceae bacterium]